MKSRKKRHNIFERIFVDSIPIEGGGYKAKISLIKIIIIVAVLVGALIALQWCGALHEITKMVSAIAS